MLKNYFAYLPSEQGSVENEWEQCLEQIVQNLSPGCKLLKINVFADLPGFSSLLEFRSKIRKSIIDSFGDQCPAFNITINPPEKPWKVSVEAVSVKSGSIEVSYKFFKSIPYIIINSPSVKELWAGGVSSFLYPDDTKKSAEEAFNLMVDLLAEEKMSLNDLVRQWNYIGDILNVQEGVQNYQIFNEVRNEYYHRCRNIPGYPAATAIGMKHGGVILDFCSLKSEGIVKTIPVNNPDQVNAYEYDQQVLKGIEGTGKMMKHPPQFERALLLTSVNSSILYISGTASILGQETIGHNDIKAQTIVTLKNINKLTDKERISQITGYGKLSSFDYISLRVYVKNQKDFPVVRSICKEYFPTVPTSFIEADICRDDLLVEIEAELLIKDK